MATASCRPLGSLTQVMKNNTELEEQLRCLEEKLMGLRPGTVEELARLLSDDFLEFGSSGSVFCRQDVIDALSRRPYLQVKLADFQVRLLAPQIALVLYSLCPVGSNGDAATLRSSIWRLEKSGWRMVFHQGTIR